MRLLTSMMICLLSFTSSSCEAAVIDPDGKSIKNSSIQVEEIKPATAVTIRDLNVKGVIPYIDMESGKVTYNKSELTGHEFSIEVDFSVFQVYVKLGEDYQTGIPVQALNTGIKSFHGVSVAPTGGYLLDSENSGLVIGNKFYDGGNGWTGFHMTKNVYALKTRSGKFAKLQFLKAKQGNIDLTFYIQQDGGTDLTTTDSE